MIRSTHNRGFQMKFENGWIISVQFGYGNYCDNGRHPEGYHFSEHTDIVSSSDAEIAAWPEGGDMYDFGGDTVKGYCSADEVADWISKIKSFEKI